jgi:regulatory protein
VKQRLSLKGQGVQLLSQRDHSRVELRRKLLKHARKAQELSKEQLPLQPQADGAVSASSASAVAEALADDPAEQVEQVLDWLQKQRYLDEARFVESRTHARAQRFGNQRIRLELAQHGLSLSAETAQHLRDTELARAKDVWLRKFGGSAPDAAGRARQMRFLAARGFSGEVIQRVVRAREDD